MTEKMLLTIEAALYKVLHAALQKADAMYPERERVATDYVKHLECVNGILGWFEKQVAALRKIRLARRPGQRPLPPRSTEETSDDWDILLMFFDSPGAVWMMTVGLSALPYDIRLLLTQTTYIMELAMLGQMQGCLSNLRDLADTLAAGSGDRGMLGKGAKPIPSPVKDRETLERESKAMAERVKKMLLPKPSSPSPKRSSRP